MKTSYVAISRIQIPAENFFYIEKSDILTFSSANANTLTIFRNQAIVKTLPFTQAGLDTLRKLKMIQPIGLTVPTVPAPTTIKPEEPAAPVLQIKNKPLRYSDPPKKKPKVDNSGLLTEMKRIQESEREK